MLRSLHFTRFLLISLALHALMIAAALFLIKPEETSLPSAIPVKIVNLPPQAVKRLPPVRRPIPAHRDLTPLENDSASVRTGKVPKVSIPKISPEYGRPDGGGKGKADAGRKDIGISERGKSALPFLSQNDIDDLARKGFPEWKLKGDVLTEETEGFRYYGYTKWALQKAQRILRYPELAAVSGLQGDVFVIMDILKDGQIGSIDVVKSSGYKILDDEVVRTLQAAAPYQPLPEEWHTDHYTIPIIGTFRLYYRELR